MVGNCCSPYYDSLVIPIGGMMKKVFIVLLVFAYLSCYLGCTTTKTLVRSVDDLDDHNDLPLKLVTKDNTFYIFKEGNYNVQGDTLIGKAWGNQKGAYLRTGDFELHRIALNDIKTIDNIIINGIDAENTFLVILGIGAVIGVFAVIAILVSFDGPDLDW